MVDREVIERFAYMGPVSDELHKVIPQEGVRHSLFPREVKHNAIWDYLISPEGRHFLSLCAEGNYSEYAHLYEFLPDTEEFRLCFKLDEAVTTYDRAIRPSKGITPIAII